MNSNSVKAIRILKEIPFFGEGDTLERRLKKVTLRGFPEVKIYEHSNIEQVFLTPPEIRSRLQTPQPYVYQEILERIGRLSDLFKEKGIDITNLEKAYDFEAQSESGEITQWTMIPPIVERFHIPSTREGTFNYESMIGLELRRELAKENLGINIQTKNRVHLNKNGIYELINDGSHRVHFGFVNGGIKVLIIEGLTPGFPYYAIPQSYEEVNTISSGDTTKSETKIHVVREPGHKLLYRFFPSGGILTGNIRSPRNGESFK